MRRAPEIKEDILLCLSKQVDEQLLQYGFKRSKRAVIYNRSFKDASQSIVFHASINPHYARNYEAHFVPSMGLKMDSVSKVALELVAGETSLLAGHPEIIVNQPLDFAAPTNSHERWLAVGEAQINQRLNEIVGYSKTWVIPYFDELKSPEDLICVYTSNDKRMMKQHHWYIYIAAAYIVLGQPKEAMSVLESKLGSTGLRKDFAVVFESVRKAI